MRRLPCRFPPENCAAANYSEAYEGAWGWADSQCGVKLPYMCKILGGWRARARGSSPAP
jgi:hypothetical protein